MRTSSYSWKQYLSFGHDEKIPFLITVLVAGFYLSLNDWSSEVVSTTDWIGLFVLFVGFVLVLLGLVVFVQKVLAIKFGYTARYRFSWVGLVIGFFVTFLSNGAFPFFLPGGMDYTLIKERRLDKYLPSYKYSELFVTTSMATVIPILISIPLVALFFTTGTELFKHMMLASILFGLFSLIPLPRLRAPGQWAKHHRLRIYKQLLGASFGYDMFSFSIGGYAVLAVTCLIFTGLMLLLQIYSVVLAFILALLVIWIYKIAINHLMG